MKHWQFRVDDGMRPILALRRAPKMIRFSTDDLDEYSLSQELRNDIDEELESVYLDPLSEEEIEELNVVLESKKWLLK